MKIENRLLAPVLLAMVAILAGCGGDDSATTAKIGDRVIRAVATTGQVGDLVRIVGGDRVEVTVLMGPGIDPHLYKASAGDVERLRTADVIFFNGLHLEARMGEVLERLDSRERPTCPVAESVPPERLHSPPEFAGAHDPHVWFDLELWQYAVGAVHQQLAALDPDHADGYTRRAADYDAELEGLHYWALDEFARIPGQQRVLITAHDAFGYLGSAYGLEVRGLQGISTASEAGTADVQQLAAFIAEREIPALFVETSVSPKAIEAVKAAVLSRGFEVRVGGEVYSDALGDAGTPAGTFTGMFTHNVETITAALCGGEIDEH